MKSDPRNPEIAREYPNNSPGCREYSDLHLVEEELLYGIRLLKKIEDEEEIRRKTFQGYQINAECLKVAASDASVMHCLPAHRGLEISDDVIEGPQSIVWQQGENKVHGAAGILDFFLYVC